MRRLAAILLSAFTALLLSGAIPTSAPSANALDARCPAEVPASGVDGAVFFSVHTRQEYLRDEFRLGPLFLPLGGRIGRLLRGYNRLGYGFFGNMTANDFLECYWTPNVVDMQQLTGTMGWKYPPNQGFAGTPTNQPVPQGARLQLFGFWPNGHFLAPEGTLYRQTAIPPSNLDTIDPYFPFNYHVFFVCRSFTAQAGWIAPWFQQPGGGFQYWTGKNTTVGDLVNAKNLVDVTLGPTPCP